MAGRVFAGVPRAITSALGEPVTYTPVGGQAVEVRGVFTRDYIVAGQEDQLSAESFAPAVTLRAADCPNRRQGDAFSIGGEEFTAVEVQPDGRGMVVFILHEAAS
ncbi:MAG: head-tail joining protein [Oceanicaulis sp.]